MIALIVVALVMTALVAWALRRDIAAAIERRRLESFDARFRALAAAYEQMAAQIGAALLPAMQDAAAAASRLVAAFDRRRP